MKMVRLPERAKNGLELTKRLFHVDSDPTVLKDIVLVAIDFENFGAIQRHGKILDTGIQAGFAMLDISILSSPSLDIKDAISTYNFAAGSSKFGNAASRRFQFGESSTITAEELLPSINNAIPRSRTIVLIGYNMVYDLRALCNLRTDFRSAIYGAVDVAWVAREVLPSFTGTLEDLLGRLHCPYRYLHCAGNDAYFTLRALLLLVLWNKSDTVYVHDRLIVLRDLAYSPIPGCQSSAYDSKEFEEDESTTKATRRKRNNKARHIRQRSLSKGEKLRANAASEQDRERSVAMKIRKQERSKELQDANLNARAQVRAERELRREDYPDYNLEGLELLLEKPDP